MKIEELSELSDIKIESIKELVKDKGVVYAVGVDLKGLNREITIQQLKILKEFFTNNGVNALIYPLNGEIGKLKIHKLERGEKQ